MAVLFGFVIDSLTLRRIDLWAEHIVVLSYLGIAAVAIIVMHLYNEGRLHARIFDHADWWVPLVMQFAFGGLFSAFLLFYGRSGSIASNWPALLILLGLLVGNEFFRRRYQRLMFNVSVWYTAVLAYCIFAVPVVVSQIGGWVFILSGLCSVLIAYSFIYLLSVLSPVMIRELRRTFMVLIGGILLSTSLLYFSHAIPPIPMSLQTAEIAHNVNRTASGDYQIALEERVWYDSIIPGETIHTLPGDPVYLFSSVFAPTGFDTNIAHRWQYRQGGEWETASRISFPVIGGRTNGYRGYSRKTNVQPGKWRVLVETGSGRRLGKESFWVEHTDTFPQLQTVIR
jgi:hypothetical protein